MSELLTAEELGLLLKVAPETVKAWARQGRIPAVRVTPKVIRFDTTAVLTAISRANEKGFRNDG
jgi:excisionase family DNA binding protein